MIKIKKNKTKIILSLIMLMFSFIMMMPLIWMISSSLKPEPEVMQVPFKLISKNFKFDNYKEALTMFPYLKWFFNSIKVTFLIIILSLSVSTLAGYAFGRLKFRGKEILFLVFLSAMMIPSEVKMLPQFLLFRQLGLNDSHIAVVIPWMFNIFGVFFLRNAFMAIPNDLAEAAKIDGLGEFKIFTTIMLPLIKTVIITMVILLFTWSWNEFLMPLVFISSIDKQLLPVGLSYFKEDEMYSRTALTMAGMSMAIVPLLIVFLVLQKYFVEGISTSGIKS